ncbi:MAG: acetolactate synthase small subunit [Candidatus Cellulosilyticum pullistercoris]|uniref:Acetolactate synthase small subunit n=1 Tax=Candidatus Cellulosilyticum pullistercoris TaxID=2838521 RepID=A0A9E2NMY0_9FIRM|nr:acetolactate synthase small subunit [Candidatus Cellulosilyticum pullistercoris]
MKKHVLSVLVENHSGVLSRVSGLFSRRGYNIDSLSVGETEDPKISRMTIVADADEYTLEQIKKQLNKLIDVIKIIELKEENAIYRELALIKIAATKENRAEIIEIANIFRAHIVDVASKAVVIEATGDQGKINALTNMLMPYGIKEVIRTGLTALERGEKELKN